MPRLEWIGKEAVVNHHERVPYRLLRCNPARSVGEAGSGNLLVQGDNLEALKALLPYYAAQVKCIYIDPPYNTGNENWVYNDAVNSPEMRDWLGQVVGRDAEDLSRHDKWLCMMYPRLALLRQFLRRDGVILISINDVELHHLRVILDELYGIQNLLATIVWEKGKKGDSHYFSGVHEYIVVVARDKAFLDAKETRWRKKKAGIDEVLEYYQTLCQQYGRDHERIRENIMKWYRTLPKGHLAKNHKHYKWSDDRGLYFAADFSGPDDGRKSRPRYDIMHPITGKPCKKPSTGWRWEEERTKAALAEQPSRIHFGPDESTVPCRKSYLAEIDEEPITTVFYKDGRAATLLIEQILGPGAFSFPKDVEILAELIGTITENDDIILDSFAGSGTTGHAVLKLNHTYNTNRRFILVEMVEEICQNRTAKHLEKAILGYEPINIKKSEDDEGSAVPGLGGGFRYCELGPTLFDAEGKIREEVSFRELAQHIYFTETGEPLPQGSRQKLTPLLGVAKGVGVYLLYNGILQDKSVDGGNVLTSKTLALLPEHDGPKVIYGNACRLSPRRLKAEGITFRQTPYEIRTR